MSWFRLLSNGEIRREPRWITSRHNGDRMLISGYVKSYPGKTVKGHTTYDPVPGHWGQFYAPMPWWNGLVLATWEEIGRVVRVHLRWVDEGAVAVLQLYRREDGTVTGKFVAPPVDMRAVMAAQERWQRFRGLNGRNDSRDLLVHPGWKWTGQGEVKGRVTERGILFTVEGKAQNRGLGAVRGQ